MDRFGQPIPEGAEAKDRFARSIPDSVRDRASLDNVLGDVTPSRLRSIFEEADNGHIGRQVELAETIEERDAHVRSVLETRRLAAAGVDYVVHPGDESEPAQKAAEEFRAAWNELDNQSLIELLLGAVLPQYAIARVTWDTSGNLWTPIGFEEVDARRLVWPQSEPAGDAEARSAVTVPGLTIDWSMSNTVPLTPGAYVVHSVRAKRGRPGRMAAVRAVAFWWMVKRFSVIDWSTLLEQFGRPWRLVKHEPSLNPEQVRELLATLREASADLCVAIPKTAEAELVQGMSTGGGAPHEAFATFCDRQVSKALIGTTTISDPAGGTSESVSSPTHADVARRLRDADALSVAGTIRRDLVVPWCHWNFGASVAAPRFEPNLETRPEPGARAKVYIDAGQLGLSVKAEQLYRELAIERPDDVPDVIELRPAMMPGAMPWGEPNRDREGAEGEGRSQKAG